MKYYGIIFLTVAFIFGAGSVFAQDAGPSSLAEASGEPQVGSIPTMPVTPAPFVACNGGSAFTAIADYPAITDVTSIVIQNVRSDYILRFESTVQIGTLGANQVACALKVTDAGGHIFYADPDRWPNFYFAKPADENYSFQSATWWIDPSDYANFVLGDVTATLQVTEMPNPSTTAYYDLHSLCGQQIYNAPGGPASWSPTAAQSAPRSLSPSLKQ
jgi:hypothetical protein